MADTRRCSRPSRQADGHAAWPWEPALQCQQHARQEAAYSLAGTEQTMQGPAISQATVTTAEPRRAPTPGSPPPYVPKVPHTPLPACTHAPTHMTPPTLRNVILADLGDVARLLALHQHAIARGWLQAARRPSSTWWLPRCMRGGLGMRRVGCSWPCCEINGGRSSPRRTKTRPVGCCGSIAMGLPHAHERQPPCPRYPCPTTRALCCEPSKCSARPDGRASCFSGSSWSIPRGRAHAGSRRRPRSRRGSSGRGELAGRGTGWRRSGTLLTKSRGRTRRTDTLTPLPHAARGQARWREALRQACSRPCDALDWMVSSVLW